MMPSSKRMMREFSLVRYYSILAISIIYFLAQLGVAHYTHSLVLQVDAYHMLYNILSLITCIVTIRMSQPPRSGRGGQDNSESKNLEESGSERKTSALKNTFGWTRIDVGGAVANLCFLSALCFSVLVDAVQTILHASHHGLMSEPLMVGGVALAGLGVNFICFLTIGGYTFHETSFLSTSHALGDEVVISASIQSYVQQGIKSRRRQGFLECFRDIFGTLLVILCATLLNLGKNIEINELQTIDYVDPVFCIITVVGLVVLSYSYAKEACHVLLLTIPDHINVKSLLKELERTFPEIYDVHDFHVWQLTPARVIASAHIVLKNTQNYHAIHNNIVDFLHTKGISHVTLQPEFIEVNAAAESPGGRGRKCFIPCEEEDCREKMCCEPPSPSPSERNSPTPSLSNRIAGGDQVFPTLVPTDSATNDYVTPRDAELMPMIKPAEECHV